MARFMIANLQDGRYSNGKITDARLLKETTAEQMHSTLFTADPALLVSAVLAWKDRYWSIAFRGYYTPLTVAAVAFVWFLNYWNLLGWRF